MAYGRSTTFFDLPYMESGDYLTEADEAARAGKIDSLLYVATYGVQNAILVDGVYSLEDVTAESCSLTISTNSSVQIMPNTYAVFIAVVKKFLAYRTSEITVEGLLQGAVWRIYASYNDSMPSSPSQVTIEASQIALSGANHLLLATVDFTGASPVLDHTTGKTFYANVANHALTSTNPHGETLTQADLNVTDELKISGNKTYSSKIMDVVLEGEPPMTIESSSTGLVPEFVTLMPGSTGASATISNGDIVVSFSTTGTIKMKIEGDPVE